MSIVLRVQLPVGTYRQWGIRSANREVEEELALWCREDARVSLRYDVDVPVFAVDVYVPIHIHSRHIDTPLEPVGMIRNAGNLPALITRATLRVRTLELPLDLETRIQLGDEIRSVG